MYTYFITIVMLDRGIAPVDQFRTTVVQLTKIVDGVEDINNLHSKISSHSKIPLNAFKIIGISLLSQSSIIH